MLPLFQIMITMLELIDEEEKQEIKLANLRCGAVISTVNILTLICEIAIEILESESVEKLHRLLPCLQVYRYMNFF